MANLASTTISGTITEKKGTASISGTTLTVDMSTGNYFEASMATASGNIATFTITNPPSAGNVGSFVIKITQGSTARSFNWATMSGARPVWESIPVIPTEANAQDVYTFTTYDGGTIWYGSNIGTEFKSVSIMGSRGVFCGGDYATTGNFQSNPAAGGLLIKQLSLDGTDPIPTLNGVTVSGGRLNLYNSALLSMETMAADSLDPNPVTNVTADTSEWYRVTLNWNDPTELFGGDPIPNFMINIYRDGELTSSVWQGIESFIDIGLPADTEYIYTFVTRVVNTDSMSIVVSIPVIVAGGSCHPGDLTENNIVDVLDVVQLLRFALGYNEPSPAHYCTGDLNYDNYLNITDVLMLMDIILGV